LGVTGQVRSSRWEGRVYTPEEAGGAMSRNKEPAVAGGRLHHSLHPKQVPTYDRGFIASAIMLLPGHPWLQQQPSSLL